VEPLSIRINGDRKTVHKKGPCRQRVKRGKGNIKDNNCPHTRGGKDGVHEDTQTSCDRARGSINDKEKGEEELKLRERLDLRSETTGGDISHIKTKGYSNGDDRRVIVFRDGNSESALLRANQSRRHS